MVVNNYYNDNPEADIKQDRALKNIGAELDMLKETVRMQDTIDADLQARVSALEISNHQMIRMIESLYKMANSQRRPLPPPGRVLVVQNPIEGGMNK